MYFALPSTKKKLCCCWYLISDLFNYTSASIMADAVLLVVEGPCTGKAYLIFLNENKLPSMVEYIAVKHWLQ